MNQLFFYVTLIKHDPENAFIVDRQSCEEHTSDDWSTSCISEQILTFKNGVKIKQSIEKETEASQPDVACEECFISYEVLTEPSDCEIMPKTKRFINQCQEAFWLKMNTIQNQ
jgi:hypothetical protein